MIVYVLLKNAVHLFMFFSPSWRKKRYDFLKTNEVWSGVFIVDLFGIPATIILKKLSSYVKLITPNAISLVSFVFFFIGVGFMFTSPDKFLVYTLMFFAANVFDGVDGKLARATNGGSDFGAIVDAFFDMINHSVGLALVGLALGIKVGDYKVLAIMLPYSFYLGAIHINSITDYVMRSECPTKYDFEEKTAWQKFCYKRGLSYSIYTDVDTIYFSILLIGINLPNPWLWLLISIYLRFITIGLRKIFNVRIKLLQALFG